MTKPAAISLVTRAAWTALQSFVGVLAVSLSDIVPNEVWWVVPIAAVLSAVKSFIASKVGDPETVTFQ